MAHGDALDADRTRCDGADLVIAADGGSLTLERWGITPHVVVGDLDSLDRARVDRLADRGAEVLSHPKEKDESDMELALALAMRRGARDVTLLGAFGSRLDHTLANVTLVADPTYRELALRAVRGTTQLRPLHGGAHLTIERPAGSLVTLLPVRGDAEGVRTTGLRYPLDGDTLAFGRSRGLSNVVTASPATVSLASGVLLVIETEEMT